MNKTIRWISLIGFALLPAGDAPAQLPANVEDGVMLHCHTWPFNAIEQNLDRIAAAGYNAIQVSPVQRIRQPRPDEINQFGPTGPWYLYYQPVSFMNVGNYKSGDEQDFQDLCDAAEQRGIRIIIDVVLNHVADTGLPVQADPQLDLELRDPNLYHHHGTIDNYQDRFQLTQRSLLGLPDFNTQLQPVQDIHVRFLNHCVSLGADGFRFDAAKHIETSGGADSGWAGDYWEDVLHRIQQRDQLYLFGEVLQDTGDNLGVYLTYFDVTAHNFGRTLRDAVRNRNVHLLQGHESSLAGVPRSRGLAYFENHDDYEHNESRHLTPWERKMAHAYLTARAGLVPRLLDRAEDDLWDDPDVAVVNQFRNAVAGTEEFLRYPSQRVAIVERGSQGVVIVNLGHDTALDVETGLAPGSYANLATVPCTLQVANGRLTGQLPGGLIFASLGGAPGAATIFRAHYDTGFGRHLALRGDTPPLSWAQGIPMQWTSGNVWVWETSSFPPHVAIEFKVLINDVTWEVIDGQPLKNHQTTGGATADVTPVFP